MNQKNLALPESLSLIIKDWNIKKLATIGKIILRATSNNKLIFLSDHQTMLPLKSPASTSPPSNVNKPMDA